MVCKYFLPLHTLLLHFVGGFLCCAEAFSLLQSHLFILLLLPLLFCQIQKLITKTSVKELTAYIFFWEFMVSDLTQAFDPF